MSRLRLFPMLALLLSSTSLLPTQVLAQTADKQAFLDDRSTPIEVLRSYYNAINRKEYVRAYYYWAQQGTSATSLPPAYPQFAAGYAKTASVQLTTGQVNADTGAGTTTYRVPVTLVAMQNNGSKQTFIGCYTIRQPQPLIFGEPPFTPMGISSARIRPVYGNQNRSELMQSATAACSTNY